ncbi:MAG: hypothetical protein J6Z23_05140 [Lachnospiraceae bacterium]|nr:hypothetical protein [Lachnospiraceae bacterium]
MTNYLTNHGIEEETFPTGWSLWNSTSIDTKTYTYGNSGWKDQLTAYSGSSHHFTCQ